MKKFYTLFALIIATATILSAQTYLAQDFGKTRTEVEQFLASKPEATVQASTNMIAATTVDGFRIEYHFNEDVLYKTHVVRYFGTLKEARTTIDAFHAYYQLLGAAELKQGSDRRDERFAAVHGREIHEVSLFALDRGAVQVSQTKLDLDRCPGSEMMQIVRDENIFAMISR